MWDRVWDSYTWEKIRFLHLKQLKDQRTLPWLPTSCHDVHSFINGILGTLPEQTVIWLSVCPGLGSGVMNNTLVFIQGLNKASVIISTFQYNYWIIQQIYLSGSNLGFATLIHFAALFSVLKFWRACSGLLFLSRTKIHSYGWTFVECLYFVGMVLGNLSPLSHRIKERVVFFFSSPLPPPLLLFNLLMRPKSRDVVTCLWSHS